MKVPHMLEAFVHDKGYRTCSKLPHVLETTAHLSLPHIIKVTLHASSCRTCLMLEATAHA